MSQGAFDLNSYVKKFHDNKQASIITNRHGQILEVNNSVATLMSIEDASFLAGKLLVSLVHRKYVLSCRELIRKVSKSGSGESNEIWLRPRVTLPFQANLRGHVVMRNRSLVIIHWVLANANANVVDTYNRNLPEIARLASR